MERDRGVLRRRGVSKGVFEDRCRVAVDVLLARRASNVRRFLEDTKRCQKRAPTLSLSWSDSTLETPVAARSRVVPSERRCPLPDGSELPRL